jgi:hypothetical protein
MELPLPDVKLTYFIRKVYSISPITDASSAERLLLVFSSNMDKISIISLAWGRFIGGAGCWGSKDSPISMREEVPKEKMNEEKDTGGVGGVEFVDEKFSGVEVFEDEGVETSASVRPRLSRTTNPRSSSLTGNPPYVGKHYH